MKRLKRAEILEREFNKFKTIKEGQIKRERLEYIRQTFGNSVAEKFKEASPTFRY